MDLKVTVDREGKVTAAEVALSAGDAFDGPATDAALRAVFEPARRANGEAIPSRVKLRVVFQYDAEPETPAATPVAAEAPTPSQPTIASERALPNVAAPRTEPSAHSTDEDPEVAVWGHRTDAQKLQESAEAVVVYDLRHAHRQSADLGELMARMEGVTMRRDGGLGSGSQFALNGLQGEQIATFVDGVPLEYAGFTYGVNNIPVNLVERLEVYRGVVPVRFGADALGGAVNIVTDQSYRSRLGVSYQVGSYAEHRLTLDGLYRNEKTGIIAGGWFYVDKAKNDYDVDVEIPDAQGRPIPATVPRFHDRYSAYGLTLQTGVVDRPWAKRLILQGFATHAYKEIQSNLVMTVPYGEVNYTESASGLTLRYEQPLSKQIDFEAVANYTHRATTFSDMSSWVYDWNGQQVHERKTRGEIGSTPTDSTIWQDSVYTRAYVKWAPSRTHSFRLAVTPTFTNRTGEERAIAEGSRDPLSGTRDRITVISGLEYELSLWEDRFANVFFVKDYAYHVNAAELLAGGIFRDRSLDSHTQGIGDAIRYRFTKAFMLKASYEYTTRLPSPDEVFGDGKLIQANLELTPEISHNANIGPRLDADTPLGSFIVDVNGFFRDTDKQIVLLGSDRFFTYQNLFAARNLGVETNVKYVAPGAWLGIGGTVTYMDLRNTSTEGPFSGYDGDRIPYRPYFFGGWNANLRFKRLPGNDDTIEPYYFGRYVHDYFRGWESVGTRDSKQVVPTQVVHTVGVSWVVHGTHASWASTFEIDNLLDQKNYEFYGVQRPGRAFYLKMSGAI